MKCSLVISNFLEEISSLSYSIVFLYFLHCSLTKAFFSLLAILWNSAQNVYMSYFTLYIFSIIFIVGGERTYLEKSPDGFLHSNPPVRENQQESGLGPSGGLHLGWTIQPPLIGSKPDGSKGARGLVSSSDDSHGEHPLCFP